jgi:hypothetical protein
MYVYMYVYMYEQQYHQIGSFDFAWN